MVKPSKEQFRREPGTADFYTAIHVRFRIFQFSNTIVTRGSDCRVVNS